MISAELASFLESGVSVLVGTRDARCVPDAMRGLGVRVERGGTEVTVWLPAATAGRALANLRDNRRLAVCFSQVADHRSMQLKGAVLEVREATADERPIIERHRSLLLEMLHGAGVPPRVVLRLNAWPAHAVRFRVEGVFVQTPGPGAGARLGAAR